MKICECCDGTCGKDIRVSFCPKCNSRRVGYIFSLGNLFGVIPKMRCKDCGFSAPSFPVLIANEEELKKAIGEMKAKRNKGKGPRDKAEKSKVIKKVNEKKVVKKIGRKKK